MRAANGWRSGSRFRWLVAGVWAAVLTAVLAPVALAQSPGLEPPERPRGLRAEVSHDVVRLSWDDPGDAAISGYQILRRDRDLSPVGVFEVLVEDTGSAAAAYADRRVQPETRYNYRVKARNAAGLSRRSNFVRADTPAAPEEAIEEALKKAIEALPEEAVTVWTGQLTVGVFAAAAPPVAGYAGWTRQGALSPESFWFDKKEYTVLGLLEHGGGLNLVLDRPLPHDFVLELGARRYESGASLEPVFVWAGRYWWPDDAIGWAAGDELTVSIVLDPGTTASARAPAPPSAYLAEAPAAHNGRDAFSLRLIFDEPELPLSAALLRDHALQVSGGSVVAVAARAGSTTSWTVTLQPDGDAPLTVSLPSPADCADAGAVCSADGRKLRGRLTATIAGPPQLAALRIVGATLSPAFDPATEFYTAEAEAGLEQVTVEAAAGDRAAVLTITPADADAQQAGHQVALAASGETAVELRLQAATGETARVYWVVVSRAAATEAPSSGLNELRLGGLPALAFSEQQSRYELDAPDDLTQTTVVVSRAESEAGVDIFTVRGDELVADDADHDPGAPGHQVRLSGWGDTLLLVRVTSGDGRSQRVYATHLRGEVETAPPAGRSETRSAPRKPASSGARDDEVPTLSALSLGGASLIPAFASDVFEYQADAAADVAEVTVSATPSASDGTLTVIPADADALQTGHQVSLGAAGTETVIAVIVSNAAGQLNSYLLTVLRELPATPTTPTTLQSLVVEGHELSPAFAAAVPLYSVDAGANVSDVTLTAVATADTATIDFVPADADANAPGYQVALGSPGAQTTTSIAIIISAPGAAAHTTYVVIITRAAPDPSDAALQSLSLDGHALTPAFDPETSDYALTVPADSGSVTIRAVSSSPSASLSVSPPDADPLEPGHQIPLAAVEPGGEPSLTTAAVTVTSADLATTQTYTITVTRRVPRFLPVTMELPPGCTLRDILIGPNEGQWKSTCHAIYPRTGYYVDYSFATWYRLIVLEESEVTIDVASNTNRRIVVRDREGTVVGQRLIERLYGGYDQSMTRTLAPGTYVIELVQHNSGDGRERFYTMTVTGLQEPRLSDLQLTGIDLPDFSSDQLEYDVVRPAGGLAMTMVVATPQAPATGGDVTILPPDADPITAGHQVALARGEPTEVQVHVVHPLSEYEVAYKVTVAPDAELAPSGLTTVATAAGVELHWLAPARESATVTGYAVWRHHLVRRETELTTLTADTGSTNLAYLDGTATQSGHRYRYEVRALRNGEVSGASHIAEIEYYEPADARLQTLRVPTHDLAPAFDREVYEYALTLPAHLDALDLEIVSRSVAASFSVSPAGADPLKPGDQIPLAPIEPGDQTSLTTITVVVTSADLSATRTYTITVTLSELYFSPVTMDLPSDCTLRDFQSGPNAGQWTSDCWVYNWIFVTRPWPTFDAFASYYRLAVREQSDVAIQLTSAADKDTSITVYTRDGTEVDSRMCWRTDPGNDTLTLALAPGTYVIQLTRHDSSPGSYSMTVTGEHLLSTGVQR